MKLTKKLFHIILTLLIALVWFINGFICKVLNFVPRHEQIVGNILGQDYAGPLTILIGLSEVFMSIWILSKYKSKFNAITQIAIVATMNILEFILVPDLLLWGKFNSLFALLFIATVYYHQFILKNQIKMSTNQ